MNKTALKIMTHLGLVGVGSLMLHAATSPWDAGMLLVSLAGVSSGALTLQVIWAELHVTTH